MKPEEKKVKGMKSELVDKIMKQLDCFKGKQKSVLNNYIKKKEKKQPSKLLEKLQKQQSGKTNSVLTNNFSTPSKYLNPTHKKSNSEIKRK